MDIEIPYPIDFKWFKELRFNTEFKKLKSKFEIHSRTWNPISISENQFFETSLTNLESEDHKAISYQLIIQEETVIETIKTVFSWDTHSFVIHTQMTKDYIEKLYALFGIEERGNIGGGSIATQNKLRDILEKRGYEYNNRFTPGLITNYFGGYAYLNNLSTSELNEKNKNIKRIKMHLKQNGDYILFSHYGGLVDKGNYQKLISSPENKQFVKEVAMAIRAAKLELLFK